ncbi:MAG: signal peptidase II [Oceanicoccus sp.]|jgi:signal peptidase II
MTTKTARKLDQLWLYFAPLTGGLIVADQITKVLAYKNLKRGDYVDFGWQLVYNDGIVFGIDLPIWFIFGMTIAILALGTYLVIEEKLWQDKWHLTGLALILSGAIGNIIDRVRLGYVIDFIKVYWWPNFNLADVFIVCGVLLFAWEFLIREEKISEI